MNNIMEFFNPEIILFLWECLSEIVITHKDFLYNNLGLDIRKWRTNNNFYKGV